MKNQTIRKTLTIPTNWRKSVPYGVVSGSDGPQIKSTPRAAKIIPAPDLSRLLRLVCDTAAVRTAGKFTDNFGEARMVGFHPISSARHSANLAPVKR